MKIKRGLLLLLPFVAGCIDQNETHNKNKDQFKGYEEIRELKEVAFGDIDRSRVNKISVDLDKKNDEVDLKKVIDSVSFIRLEMSQNSIIGHIDKVYFDDGKIFVVDRTSAKAIFIFDDQGNFINKIAAVGKAPNEFLEIQDVAIDKENKRIVLLDLAGRRCIFFNYNGDYSFGRQMYFYFSGLEIVDSSHIAFSTETAANDHLPSINNNYLLVGDFQGKVFSKDFPYRDADRAFTYFNEYPVKRFGQHVFFNPRFNDTLFEVTANRLIARYALEIQHGGIPVEYRTTLTDSKLIDLSARYSYFNGEYVQAGNVLFAKINSPQSQQYIFTCTSSGNVLFGNRLNITDPSYNFFRTPIAIRSDHEMVGWIGADELTRFGRSLRKIKQTRWLNERFTGLLKNLSDNDNPVLFVYKIKDF